MSETQGSITFMSPSLPPNKPCQTFYKIINGPLSGNGDTTPLIALHGGPGATHDYLLILADLDVPLIVYDQIGSGKSTHYTEKMGDTSFWTVQLFLDELDNLIQTLGVQDKYDLAGHSWGGMLAASHAVLQPKGLRKLMLMSSPADMKLWMQAQVKLKKRLPQDVQDAIEKNESEGTTDSADYKRVMGVFYEQFLCRLKPMPELLLKGLKELEKNPTVYSTMNGPSEFHVTGPLAKWSIVNEAHKINVPTLLTNGAYDEAQDESVAPYFREIPKVKWVRFENSSHMPHFEERERYMEVVKMFLEAK